MENMTQTYFMKKPNDGLCGHQQSKLNLIIN